MVQKPLKFVSYLRVSTSRQGRSGLGLEAQREANDAYAAAEGGKIVAEFIEVESGKRSDNRPELAKALRKTRATGGCLLIARLCRLARNVHFVSGLLESNVAFKCVDMPEADRSMLQMMSVFYEYEARCIGERTRLALAQAKKRGVKLGLHRRGARIDWKKGMKVGLPRATAAAAAQRATKREDSYSDLMDDIRSWRDAGASYRAIAAKLNERGLVTTGRGKNDAGKFHATTIKRLLA